MNTLQIDDCYSTSLPVFIALSDECTNLIFKIFGVTVDFSKRIKYPPLRGPGGGDGGFPDRKMCKTCGLPEHSGKCNQKQVRKHTIKRGKARKRS